MGNPESRYIRNIDREAGNRSDREVGDTGRQAEQALIEFFGEEFPDARIRPATELEDAGDLQFEQGKAIDAVLYIDKEPAMGIQITTATDELVRAKKMQELKDHPFVRLSEMKPQDPAIPKVLIYMDAKLVHEFAQDHSFETHPQLAIQIIDGAINSLEFDLLQTQSSKEIARLNSIINLMKREKMNIEEKYGLT